MTLGKPTPQSPPSPPPPPREGDPGPFERCLGSGERRPGALFPPCFVLGVIVGVTLSLIAVLVGFALTFT